MLLSTQRNELFQILQKRGLQPSDFSEDMGDGWYRIRLRGQESNIYFDLERIKKDNSDYYRILKRPGSIANPDSQEISEPQNWDNGQLYFSCVIKFMDWAASVKREVSSPDLWAENARALQLFSSSGSLISERFSVSELGAVQGQLRVLIQNFEASDLPDEAKEKLTIISRSALLKADTFNKKDWQNWITGAFANAVSSLGLDQKQIQEITALVRQAFGGLFLQD